LLEVAGCRLAFICHFATLSLLRYEGTNRMAIRVDPENNETRALFDMVDFSGQRVLEIGCGDGRLTWRYADRTVHVTAIDAFAESIAQAKKDLPGGLEGRVDFQHVAFEAFAATRERPSEADGRQQFDIALLSWSL
jgi:2-polyprenyl-3-methyl-5-hydroxy-6-metoxy-1,4-benzoquinol methylase